MCDGVVAGNTKLCDRHENFDTRGAAQNLMFAVCNFKFLCCLFFWNDVHTMGKNVRRLHWQSPAERRLPLKKQMTGELASLARLTGRQNLNKMCDRFGTKI